MFTKKLIAVLILFFILPPVLKSQGMNEVSISGYVKGAVTGRPVYGVLLEYINENDTTQKMTAVSDFNGEYLINMITKVPQNSDDINIPSNFRLEQNYPNPFNPSTAIQFQIPKTTEVQLDIYNMLGQKIRTLVNQTFLPGVHSSVWDGTNENGIGVSAGLYFYQLRTNDYLETRKMILLDGSAGDFRSFSTSISDSKPRNKSLLKQNNSLVTIRATGARIQRFEQKNVIISGQSFRFDVDVIITSLSIFNSDQIVVSEPDKNNNVYISGLAGAVIDTVMGTEKASVVNQRTLEEVAMRVDYNGGFPLMYFKGAVGDQLAMNLCSNDEQVGDTLHFTVNSNTSPKIIKTKPGKTTNSILTNTIIFIYFTEPMDTNTINNSSLTLNDGTINIPGKIGFLHNSLVTLFSPTQPLNFLTNYLITLTNDIADMQGNHLENEYISNFTTGPDSAVGGKIVFYSEDVTNGLFTIDSDGNNLIQLTDRNMAGWDGDADWSPDGTKIVFARSFWGTNPLRVDLFIMNSDGTYLENLTNTPSIQEGSPSFSPDGSKIAFITNRDGNDEIYIMNVNGTDLVNLTNTPNLNEIDLDWSPDGNKIVFRIYHESRRNDIIIMDNDGSNWEILKRKGPYSYPKWSPNGNEIAFRVWPDDNLPVAPICVMNADSTNLRIVANSSKGVGSAWSPDGRRIAFIFHYDSEYALAIVDKVGTDLQLVYPQVFPGPPYYWVETPAWSPWPLPDK